MSKIILITGGQRSGKSRYAEELALMGTKVSVACEDFGTKPNGKKRDVGDLEPHEIARIRSELGV